MELKKIGVYLELHTLTEAKLEKAISEVLKPAYKNSIQGLRKLIYDQPMTSMEKAVFWTEYMIRHKSTKHLAYHGIQIPFYQKYFLDFISIAVIVICLLCKLVQVAIKSILFSSNEKVKTS